MAALGQRKSRVACLMSALPPRKRTSDRHRGMSALGHVWTAPSWQGLSSRVQHWSVQPCVRPIDAAGVAAGPNALRGSCSNRKHAFEYALTQAGSPRAPQRPCLHYVVMPSPTALPPEIIPEEFRSLRPDKPILRSNLAAIPDSLLNHAASSKPDPTRPYGAKQQTD